MSVTCTGEDRNLRLAVSGEVDHHGARAIMQELDRQVDAGLPRRLTLDLSGVTFMDSSGIGLIMGRYRLMNTLGGTLRVRGAYERMDKVMRLAGLDKLGILEPAGRAENG